MNGNIQDRSENGTRKNWDIFGIFRITIRLFFLFLLHLRGGGGDGGVGVWVCEYVSVNNITENLGTNFRESFSTGRGVDMRSWSDMGVFNELN